MKEDIEEIIEIPEKVEVKLDDGIFEISGEKGSVKKKMSNPKINIKVKEKKIIFSVKKATKREKKIMQSFKAHVINMIRGVKEGYAYKLKICSSHFPMNVSVENKDFVIKNFIGEKTPRRIKLKGGVNVKVDGTEIVVGSPDKELAGQTAADIENLTKRPGFDTRIFQDGIFIIDKAGKIIK